MTELLPEFDEAATGAPAVPARVRPGLVFLPCARCHTPIDVAIVAKSDQLYLCQRHRAEESADTITR
jgi:hypothetical protein